MKIKPYGPEHIQEFEQMTADLSLEAKGAWISVRMVLARTGSYCLSVAVEQLARLLRCTAEKAVMILEEFQMSITCGLRVEWPPGNADVTAMKRPSNGSVTLVYEPIEKRTLSSSSLSLRVFKSRESKKNKEVKRMPEDWDLREEMKDFARCNGMSNATVTHEFARCKLYHAENLWTEKGWNGLVWQKWVLNWVSYGRKQVAGDVWNDAG